MSGWGENSAERSPVMRGVLSKGGQIRLKLTPSPKTLSMAFPSGKPMVSETGKERCPRVLQGSRKPPPHPSIKENVRFRRVKDGMSGVRAV